MVCESCGEKKPKSALGGFPRAVVEIKNPEEIVMLRKVVVPASLGDDVAYPPVVGKYCNVVLYYEANDQVYLYSSDSIPTKITVNVEALKRQINQVAADLETETGEREAEDKKIWDEIEEIEMSSDVVDIVGTYAELQAYDTSKLHNNDIIKVLSDETHNDSISYYRYSKTSDAFTYVGSEGPYYTRTQINTMLEAKQDNLTAGSNISIDSNNVISAVDTTYTAGDGLSLNSTEFSVNTISSQDWSNLWQ